MSEPLPSNPEEIARLLRTLARVCDEACESGATLGEHESAKIAAVPDAAAELEAAIAHDSAMILAAGGAKARLKAAKKAAVSALREARNALRSADWEAEISQKAGVHARKAYSRTAPHAPTGLLARGVANGLVELKWERAGNKPGTFFDIEERFGEEWRLVLTVTGVRARVACPVGRATMYRVSARNPQGVSDFSNTASAW